MHTRGYWLAEYLPISRLIRKAPGRYERAFLETETDGGDTTYFLIHQLQTSSTGRSMTSTSTCSGRSPKQRDAEALAGRLRRTQRAAKLALLGHAIRHPEHLYTYDGHAAEHRVTHETARSDLTDLAERGLLANEVQAGPIGSSRRPIFQID